MKELLRKLKEIGIYIKNGAVFSINQIKKQHFKAELILFIFSEWIIIFHIDIFH